ncbi:LLM class flavin-dependent oxidoreductase [Pontibacter sp. HSC-14F20]|uniref:LLM class flavin-dependent oxidoreductase n=1 Tax=Pontibacter sp. HSC-14F20 TaxID=2864136 RepID=UPI001C72CA09|nr:LLM class flavin-dependent oxidoreductase [Pontibacter sp. HSC-14F20]MBX0335331.1 LLM class flavin-dependent oxidoreductase [Pontibacter sp. HSC-14F20]
MKISLLEFGEGDSRSNSLVRLSSVFDYAMKADELKFNRFWLAEHHLNNRKRAWCNPVAIVPVIASITQQIRVGTGGVLLKIHDPFDTASQFKLWNNIYSNRIDLGLANGGTSNIELLHRSGYPSPTFDERFSSIISYFHEEEKLRDQNIVIPPYQGTVPEVWALGASARGFHRSLLHGTNYVRSIFHELAELEPQKEIFESFKIDFEQRHGRKVKTMLSISGSCLRNEGRLKELRNEAEKDDKNHFIGTVSYFEDKLPELLQEYGADEILWRDMNKNVVEKFESLELLSAFLTKDEPEEECCLQA